MIFLDQRGNFGVHKHGRLPCLPPSIEHVIVDVVVSMAKIRHPLSVFEIVEFANSTIEKTEYEEQVTQWKSNIYSHLPNSPTSTQKLGYGWWRGLSKRHNDLLVVKRGEKLPQTDRSGQNIITFRRCMMFFIGIWLMYELWSIFHNQFSWIILVMLLSMKTKNLNSEIHIHQPNSPLGHPCDIKLIHPEYY
jgi:hypothetical protein